jgi:hypothetical protein
MLSELLAQPQLLKPPEVVVPHLVWEGRVSLFAAEEKTGKSTAAGQAAAQLAQGGEFLGQTMRGRSVLWLALDESLGDLVRRLNRFGATTSIGIAVRRPTPEVLQGILEDMGAGLLVVDTLAEFADGLVEDFNDAAQWTSHLKLLRQISEATGAGVLLLHHTNRASGKYRGSSQIGAGVDAIIEMTADPSDPTVRICRSRGRVCSETFRMRYTEHNGYQLEAGELTLDMKVYRAIESNPGIGTRRIRELIPARAAEVDAALEDLLGRRAIEDRGTPKAHQYHTTLEHSGHGPGHGSGHGGCAPPNSNGTRVGTHLGHPLENPRARPPYGGETGHATAGQLKMTVEG